MSLFGIWPQFGFTANPYSQETLGPDEIGDQLLVGRDREISELHRRIGSAGSHPSVEGPVGAGKTSLLNVASFRMLQMCTSAKQRELYLPCVQRFQPKVDLVEFEADVFRAVAQTLIQYGHLFELVGLSRPNMRLMDTWLNSPQYGMKSGELNIVGSGLAVGRGTEPNSSEGFARSGFFETVRIQLEASFPPGTGGVICVLDNLEIVETAGAARSRLDELRDRVFNVPQIRWVLCGSRGIVSRARTERLSGIFQAPLRVGPLDDAHAIEAINRRVHAFGLDGYQAPVTPQGFEFIYKALNSNLRDSLATAQDFSHWLASEYEGAEEFPDSGERGRLLEAWLAERATDAFKDAGQVQARSWQFFEALAANGGRAGSSEYDRFGFGFQQQMVSSVTQLVDANLVVREVDPDNGSRTVNSITALGWLVYYYRADFAVPE